MNLRTWHIKGHGIPRWYAENGGKEKINDIKWGKGAGVGESFA